MTRKRRQTLFLNTARVTLAERDRHHDLYRIFYYDCPPIEKQLYHPLLQRTVDFSRTPQSKWMKAF